MAFGREFQESEVMYKWLVQYSTMVHTGFTTAGGWDCVAAVERLPALHYSVDFIFLSFGIMGFIVGL